MVDQGDYPWDFVAEPYVDTIISASVPTRVLLWSLHCIDVDGSKYEIISKHEGSEVRHRFTKVGSQYYLTVRETKQADSFKVFSLACKYVRREIRELTISDREIFLDALEVIHRLEFSDGVEKYGPKFRNYEYFVAKHLGRFTLEGYSAFHGGMSFITSHFGFIMELEQALQSIDESIALPYWEHTIDSVAFGMEWQSRSPIFKNDWFGEYPKTFSGQELHYWTEGRWAFLPVPNDKNAVEKNSFGRLNQSTNSDHSKYVGRSKSFCGLSTGDFLPGCKELNDALDTQDMNDFRAKIEDYTLSPLFGSVGGFWDCAVPLNDILKKYPSWVSTLKGILSQANNIWAEMTLNKKLVCPSNECEIGDPEPLCRCSNMSLDLNLNCSYESAYKALEDSSVIESLSKNSFLRKFIYAEKNESVVNDRTNINLSFPALSKKEGEDLIVFLSRFFIRPPKSSPLASYLVSPNDPLFGPIHSSWLKLLAHQQLKTNLYVNWTDDGGGLKYGHGINDALPFRNFSRSDTSDHYYSNKELLDMMNIKNIELSYTYGSLSWAHCDGDE
eukprot:CAMPEP_0171470556 /NCGR_PEP_ID=MMETSP0946-20130122/215_1 /TAXON_ID=109269 /ORGANISM="Vaucheria litorea, Strain CCMP2940" /LENGTH=556 /DNA_ID=CAMNT_0011999949 /DNA_START=210 /DNA_END=1880 /DNA_ORIENTATION=+